METVFVTFCQSTPCLPRVDNIYFLKNTFAYSIFNYLVYFFNKYLIYLWCFAIQKTYTNTKVNNLSAFYIFIKFHGYDKINHFTFPIWCIYDVYVYYIYNREVIYILLKCCKIQIIIYQRSYVLF